MKSMKIVVAVCGLMLIFAAFGQAEELVQLTIESVQTSVLDPANWDDSFAGELYFDALRGMLVRFPGAAAQIHAKLEEGYRIESANLVLEWERTEGAKPQRGRHGWGAEEMYTKYPGQWSAVAWALKQPWSTDVEGLRPTFNAYVDGLGYWARGGARGDGTDRYETKFGPVPLHHEAPAAELDITPVLTETSYGESVAHRLRAIEQQGFLVHKNELYDLKYLGWDGYDWCPPTGYLRMWVKPPKLVVKLRPARRMETTLPKPLDISDFAQQLREEGGRGTPSIAFSEDLAEKAEKCFARPEGMPDWQWERVQELMNFGNAGYIGRFNIAPLRGEDEQAYLEAMKNLMMTPPRFWNGHLTTDLAIVPVRYGELLPPGVIDHLKLYWTAWLHPEVKLASDLPTNSVDGKPSDTGIPSYFRGYCHGGGTMNFGHNAVMGTLLSSQFIDAEYPLRDARTGVQHLLRYWGMGTGAHQEIGDTYYQSLTLCAACALKHHAENPLDSLSARIHSSRLLEMVISMYHPNLRRTPHPLGRGGLSLSLLYQDGPYNILHNLSRDGVLMHTEDLDPAGFKGPAYNWGRIYGIPIFGGEGPPGRVAMLSPWVETFIADAIAEVVDNKTYPWRVHARSFNPGERAGWHVDYMTENYGIGSRDNAMYSSGVFSAIAQWRRTPERVNHLDDLGSLFLSGGTDGVYRDHVGYYNLLQHDNKIVAVKEQLIAQTRRIPESATSIHSTVLILAYCDTTDREVWVNDSRLEGMGGPKVELEKDSLKDLNTRGQVVNARTNDIITIKDGITYVALIPIAINTPQRKEEVTISYSYPALLVHSFFYNSDATVNPMEMYDTDTPPSAGFVIEAGDEAEYGSFAKFREHMRSTRLTLQRDDETPDLTHLEYHSGDDILQMGVRVKNTPAYRSINGNWPYIPEGIMRKSNWAIQGTTGLVELHGASIRHEMGHHAYLQVIPQAGVTIGHNGLPELSAWEMKTPQGVRVAALGKLGLARIIAARDLKRLSIKHAYPEGTNLDGWETAPALLVFGADDGWQMDVNDAPKTELLTVNVGGEPAVIVPLTDREVNADEAINRYRLFRQVE